MVGMDLAKPLCACVRACVRVGGECYLTGLSLAPMLCPSKMVTNDYKPKDCKLYEVYGKTIKQNIDENKIL